MGDWRIKLIEGVTEAILGFFIGLAEGAVDLMILLIGYIHQLSFNVLDHYPIISEAIIYTQAIALSLLAVKIAWEAFITYHLRISGDANADPGGILIRAAASVALIAGIPFIMELMFTVSTYLVGDISNLPGMGNDLEVNKLQEIIFLVSGGTAYVSGFIFFILVLVIGAVITALIALLQMVKRSAELALVAVVGPIMAIGLNSNMWGTWWKHLLSLSLAQAIQLFMFKLSFYVLIQGWFGMDVLALFVFLGFLVVTVTSPKILEKYADSTGIGRVVGGVGQQAGTFYIMRRMMMR